MKGFSFFTVAMSFAAFMGPVNAHMPEPFNRNTCIAGAQNDPAALARCYAMDDCYKNNSDSEADLRGCYSRAEESFRNAQAGKSAENRSAVITSPSSSDYDRRAGEKGYEGDRANQGKGE